MLNRALNVKVFHANLALTLPLLLLVKLVDIWVLDLSLLRTSFFLISSLCL